MVTLTSVLLTQKMVNQQCMMPIFLKCIHLTLFRWHEHSSADSYPLCSLSYNC